MNKEQIVDHVYSGWRPLVSKLVDDLVALGWNPETDLLQVKSKFQELRFYIKGTPEMQSLANQAEEDSLRLCIRCGVTAGFKSLGEHGTVTAICDPCAREDEARIVKENEEWRRRRHSQFMLVDHKWIDIPPCEHGKDAKELCDECD